MLKDAELHAEEDKERKEEVEIRNEADTFFRAENPSMNIRTNSQNVVDDVSMQD